MARKTEIVTITRDGRDKGKRFLLTEMAAEPAEEWAMRALLALMRSGIEVPDDLAALGLAGIAKLGLQSLTAVQFEEAKPLIDAMFTCIKIMPNPNDSAFSRDLQTDDIEEISTRIRLRKEIILLHIGHFMSAAPSTSASERQAALPG